jgi:hypothetical protein
MTRLLVVSDPHWSGPGETARRGHESRAIGNPALRLLARLWRAGFWLRDPHAHNDKLDRILAANPAPDLVVANGDYTLDTAFVGVSDDAACESAALCLDRLQAAYGGRLVCGAGDHELGKVSLFGGCGGLRWESWLRLRGRLGVEACWQRAIGRYRLIGVPSSVVALPVFLPEALPDEVPSWQALEVEVRAFVDAAFESLSADERVVLFCHDPTALPFLAESASVMRRLGQIEATVIGHLHTPAVFGLAQRLSGMPELGGLGATARRYSRALNRARSWRAFRVRLCPSPAGCQAFKDGGWLTAEIDDAGPGPIRWTRHRLAW